MDTTIKRQIAADFRKWKQDIQDFNRFDDRSHFLRILQNNAEAFTTKIRRNTSFFRGRIFKLEDVVKTEEEYIAFIKSPEQVFEGYDETQSGAPPRDKAIEGRLNCVGVSFLYTSNDPKTVIYELRPIKHELISIAEFKTKQSLKMADLRRQIVRQLKDYEELYTILTKIASEFSRPHYSGHHYWFTQYLAGQFINMGFEGVIFDSSLHQEGHNVVFFYPEDCEAINSHLYRVDKISIAFDTISRRYLEL